MAWRWRLAFEIVSMLEETRGQDKNLLVLATAIGFREDLGSLSINILKNGNVVNRAGRWVSNADKS